MTSLFEFGPAETTARLPVALVTDLLEVSGAGGRGVAPLEFYALDTRPAAVAPIVAAVEDVVKEEARAVDERAANVRIMIDAAREEAAASARLDVESSMQLRFEQERQRALAACEAFAAERKRYFAAAEAQIVQLALAIARRVLSREAATDSMHLQATVRAALSCVQDESECVLKVSAEEAGAWSEMFADSQLRVASDVRIKAGECTLETSVGSARLGIAAQMQEIERSFAGLMHGQAE